MDKKTTPKKGIAQFLLLFSIACTWFGAEFGGGTASGANNMNFFIKTGWIGLWTCLIATLAEGWYCFWGIELSRLTKKTNYASWLREIYYPFDKILLPIMDVFMFLGYPIIIASTISGAAQLFTDYLNVNYLFSVVIVTIAFAGLAVGGSKLLRSIGTTLTILIVITIIICCAAGIPKFWDQLIEIQRNRVMGEGYTILAAVGLAFASWGAQAPCATTIILPTCEGFRHRRDVLVMTLCGVLMITVTKFGLSALLQARWPGNLDSVIYILEATNAIGLTIIQFVYPILLFACFTSTGPVTIFSQADRWSQAKIWERIPAGSWLRKHNKAILGFFFVILAYFMANSGFGFVTGWLQVRVAYFWLVLLAIPVSVMAPIRVVKMWKEQKMTGKVLTVEEKREQEQ